MRPSNDPYAANNSLAQSISPPKSGVNQIGLGDGATTFNLSPSVKDQI